jgi:hypothetical protein
LIGPLLLEIAASKRWAWSDTSSSIPSDLPTVGYTLLHELVGDRSLAGCPTRPGITSTRGGSTSARLSLLSRYVHLTSSLHISQRRHQDALYRWSELVHRAQLGKALLQVFLRCLHCIHTVGASNLELASMAILEPIVFRPIPVDCELVRCCFLVTIDLGFLCSSAFHHRRPLAPQ